MKEVCFFLADADRLTSSICGSSSYVFLNCLYCSYFTGLETNQYFKIFNLWKAGRLESTNWNDETWNGHLRNIPFGIISGVCFYKIFINKLAVETKSISQKQFTNWWLTNCILFTCIPKVQQHLPLHTSSKRTVKTFLLTAGSAFYFTLGIAIFTRNRVLTVEFI